MDKFYVECDMQGNFLIHDQEEPLFLILYSEDDKKPFYWKSQIESRTTGYYFLIVDDVIYLSQDNTKSSLNSDAEYYAIVKQVITNTYPGTITLACEDFLKEQI